ncbi:18801_t:CDS:1, partial [Gigaspora margarita]
MADGLLAQLVSMQDIESTYTHVILETTLNILEGMSRPPYKKTKIREIPLNLDPVISQIPTQQLFSNCGDSSLLLLELLIISFMQINTTNIESMRTSAMQINTTSMRNQMITLITGSDPTDPIQNIPINP